MKKLTILIMASLLSISANAANWFFLGGSYLEPAKLYVDLDSISQSKNIAKAFTKVEYEQSREVYGVVYDKVISLKEYHCNEKPMKSRALSLQTYLREERKFSSDQPTEFTYEYPDTFGEREAKYVCSFRK